MIKIIDYKAGNAPSVLHAVTHLGYEAGFARGPGGLYGATHIVLPGVGSAKATMRSLQDMGCLPALEEAVLKNGVRFLGICVGMQILFEYSEEEETDCLGWLKGKVAAYERGKVRVPQMGWNRVALAESPANAALEDYFYFVNSYYARPEHKSDIWGVAGYGGEFAAAVRKGNIYGTQFHAEKSGEAGLALLRGFLSC